MDYKFGLIPSPPDFRDWQYGLLFGVTAVPEKYDMTGQCGPIRDQGNFGTCAGQAGSGVKDKHEGAVTSPLYIYDWAKKLDGIPDQEGTYLRTIMQVLLDKGICLESTLPYSRMSWPTMPIITEAMDNEAAQFKIGGYARASTMQEIKQSLAADRPVLAGVLVCQSFVNAPGGNIPVPGSMGADNILGLHAILVMGYDDNREAAGYKGFFKFKNSWGEDWGDQGYGYIPYEFFNWRDSLGMPAWMESWTCVDVFTPPIGCKEGWLWIGSKTANIDGKLMALDVAPFIDPCASRTLVPFRFIAENMGYVVKWNPTDKSIHFFKP